MKPIRVLQVLASLDRGGAETMIMNIYRNIDRSKIQFDFVVNDREEKYAYESEIQNLGGRIFRLPRFQLTNYRSYKKAWIELLSQHPEWKIVHGHHTSPAYIYLKAAKSLNRITIAHSHTSGGETTIKSYIKYLTRFPIRYVSSHLFTCSISAAKWMFGKKSNLAYVLNNSIETKKYIYSSLIRKEKRKELGVEGKFVIGHIGRFQTEKNHSFLIDIFKSIHNKNNNSVLLLVGDGALRSSVEKKVKMLGLTDSVIFTGVRSDVHELLQAMDVFLFPSLFEGLGIVTIEAQAAGLKCVVSNTIPKEVYLTSLIESVSLKESKVIWAEKVLKYVNGYDRTNMYEEIKSKGYDVGVTSKWLKNFYLKNWKE